MRSKEQVRDDFIRSTEMVLAVFNDFPESHFNNELIPGKWSAGQIAEHLIKVEVGTTRIFTASDKNADRDPEANIDRLKKIFVESSEPLPAYDAILPDDQPKEKPRALDKLQDVRQRLTSLIEIEDLSRILTAFDHPIVGPLTRIEWLYFTVYHSHRHVKQVEVLRESIEN